MLPLVRTTSRTAVPKPAGGSRAEPGGAVGETVILLTPPLSIPIERPAKGLEPGAHQQQAASNQSGAFNQCIWRIQPSEVSTSRAESKEQEGTASRRALRAAGSPSNQLLLRTTARSCSRMDLGLLRHTT